MGQNIYGVDIGPMPPIIPIVFFNSVPSSSGHVSKLRKPGNHYHFQAFLVMYFKFSIKI